MKRTLTIAAAAATLFVTSSCSSGPDRLKRSWDGYVNQKYADDSLIHGLLLQDVLPAYPIVGLFAGLGDWLILNPIQFWSEDIWDRRGTAYEYTQPTNAKREVSSFFDKESAEG